MKFMRRGARPAYLPMRFPASFSRSETAFPNSLRSLNGPEHHLCVRPYGENGQHVMHWWAKASGVRTTRLKAKICGKAGCTARSFAAHGPVNFLWCWGEMYKSTEGVLQNYKSCDSVGYLASLGVALEMGIRKHNRYVGSKGILRIAAVRLRFALRLIGGM